MFLPPQFNCNACADVIGPKDPRIHCLVCTDYNLCALCGLGERYTDPHLGTHQTQVLKQSGGGDQYALPSTLVLVYIPPPPPPPRPAPNQAPQSPPLSSPPRPVSPQALSPPPSPPSASPLLSSPSLSPPALSSLPPTYPPPTSPPPTSPPLTSQPPQSPPPTSPSPTSPPPMSPPTSSSLPGRPSGVPPPVPPRRPPGASRPTSTVPSVDQNSASYGISGWQPFFSADMSPTPTYITLMNDIFTYLDTRNVGNLEPEMYSQFLDDMGYLTQWNSWKMALQPTYALSKESMADKSLKNAFDLFSIDHVLLKRIQPPHVDQTGLTAQYKRILGSAFSPSMLADPSNPGAAHSAVEGPMPAITRKGFLDIMWIEALGEPSREWGNYSRLLKKYNLPRYAGWGDLPRSVLPAMPDPATLARVEAVAEHAREKGRQELAAAQAYASIAAQGRRNALDLVSDTRYVYRPY